MSDHHKTPAPTDGSAKPGQDIGGIPKTADSGLRNREKGAATTPAGAPGKAAEAAASSNSRPAQPAQNKANPNSGDAAARADAQSPEDESALESLGRAIGAPLSGEASDEEPRR